MISDDLVEREPGGSGLWLDDRRCLVLTGGVAVDGSGMRLGGRGLVLEVSEGQQGQGAISS